MGIRSIKRQIARGRMAAMGLDRINKRLSYMSSDGLPNWRKALEGESGEAAHKRQMLIGKKIKQADDARKSMKKRKVRKVSA